MSRNKHLCPTDQAGFAEAYVLGTLPEADAVRFGNDLLGCERCREAVRKVARKVAARRAALMRKLLRQGVSSSEVSRRLKKAGWRV